MAAPLDLHAAIVGDATVNDRLIDRFVGIVQFNVLADHADANAVPRRDQLANNVLPVRHVGRRRLQVQQAANQIIQPLALEHQRHLIDRVLDVLLLDYRLVGHIAEQGDFLA